MNRTEDIKDVSPEHYRKRLAEQEYRRTVTLRQEDCEWLAWAIVRIADYGLSPRPVEVTSPGTTEMAIRDLNALRSLAITLNVLSRAPGDGDST